MATVRDLISSSLRLIGAVAPGETPSSSEAQDALVVLNSLIESYSNDSLMVFNRLREEFNFIPNQQSYSMGIGGDFDTSRPQKIEYAAVGGPGGSDDLDIPIKIYNLDEWNQIVSKNMQGSIPAAVYVEFLGSVANLKFWPTPNAASKVILTSWKPLSSFTSINSVIDLPPGYFRLFRYNLAVELAPEYGKEVSALVLQAASESKELVQRMNIQPSYLGVDDALVSRGHKYNILTGE